MANVMLRGLTLLCKFILIFGMAKYLTAEELGLYGIIAITVSYAVYPLGYEFYTYSIRELLGSTKDTACIYFASHLALIRINYIFVIPILFFVVVMSGFLPWLLSVLFVGLIIVEHLNQEIFRLLVGLSKQLQASALLFMRHGSWVAILIYLMSCSADFRSLNVVIVVWFSASSVSLLLGILFVKNMFSLSFTNYVDWGWVRKGLKVSFPLLVASLLVNAVSLIERYWFAALQGAEILGYYVFFISISGALLSIADAGVFSIHYPKLIKAQKNKSICEYRAIYLNMLASTIIILSSISFVIITMLPFVSDFFDLEGYYEHRVLLYLALVAIFLHSVSYVYHYVLYSQGMGRQIMYIHLSSVVAFGLSMSAFLLIFEDKYYAVPVSVIMAYLYVLISKYFHSRRFVKI